MENINMVKKHFFLLYSIFFFGITINAQKVSNITYQQVQSNVIVSYDLETKTPSKVSLYVSTNGGNTWQGPLKKVTGQVGDKISSGSHSITWYVLEEFDELRGDKIQFQVRADTDNIETVVIGKQEWMVKNLDVSRYRNGDIIPEVKDPAKWGSIKTGAWCYYDNDPANGKIYGKLYNWYAVNDPRGLAPKGFHVPSDAEWTVLTDYLGGVRVAGGKMKSTSGWEKDGNGTNSSGFTGLPGGDRFNDGSFDVIGTNGYWWSSTVNSTYYAWYRSLNYSSGDVSRTIDYKGDGFSVRCLRD
jgi:uncharacterized protein (TIGR02145 family)